MKIIKRDRSEAEFDKNKIYDAIMKAMTFGSGIIKPNVAKEIASEIEGEAQSINDLDIHTVESMVFDKLISKNEPLTAKAYEGYRRVREFQRNVKNSTDESVMELLICESALDTIRRNVAENTDYLVDGKFDIAKQDLFNKEIVWAGSSNQRVIDVKRTLEVGRIITI